MTVADDAMPAATDVGKLGVFHLKQLWARTMRARRGKQEDATAHWHLDQIVLHGLGVGIEQALPHVFKAGPSFDDFESWIVSIAGEPDPLRVARINAVVAGEPYPAAIRDWLASIDAAPPVLTEDDLSFWKEHGYVVLHDAIDAGARDATERALWEYLRVRPDDRESWYRPKTNGVMVQWFQHPTLEANRRSRRIHKAFAQLWGTSDLWMTTDRCGFNPPVRPGSATPDARLHWDVSLHQPIPFGTQGILYLTDTAPNHGPLTLVPGFHRRVGEWLTSLPRGVDPRFEDLHALGAIGVGGKAGDLVIWHQALPHNGSANRGDRPRLVQYMNMFRAIAAESVPWL
jgi:hypothetical protein